MQLLKKDNTSSVPLRVAIAGNPNAGKTTPFDALTGSRQNVANNPGGTIEKRQGHFRAGGRLAEVVDLPGTYSLSAQSPGFRARTSPLPPAHPAGPADQTLRTGPSLPPQGRNHGMGPFPRPVVPEFLPQASGFRRPLRPGAGNLQARGRNNAGRPGLDSRLRGSSDRRLAGAVRKGKR